MLGVFGPDDSIKFSEFRSSSFVHYYCDELECTNHGFPCVMRDIKTWSSCPFFSVLLRRRTIAVRESCERSLTTGPSDWGVWEIERRLTLSGNPLFYLRREKIILVSFGLQEEQVCENVFPSRLKMTYTLWTDLLIWKDNLQSDPRVEDGELVLSS